MRFDEFFSRADEEFAQKLLGGPALRLLGLLDQALLAPRHLKPLALRLHDPAELLRSEPTRQALFELLRPDEAERLCLVLGLAGADPYASLRATRFSKGTQRERALFDFFELAVPTPVQIDEQSSDSAIVPALPLFSHQRRVARRVRRELTATPPRVLLHMPTGSGKTRTAMQVIADHLREGEARFVIWLAYSEELCEQAATEFERCWRSLGDRELPLLRFWGSHELDPKQLESRDGVLVAGLSKLYRAAMKDLQVLSRLAAVTSLVVLDEAHQAVAKTYRLTLEALLSNREGVALLGLSATPGRTWNDVNADEELAAFFAQKKVSLAIDGFPSPIDYLMSEGYLAEVDFKPLLHRSGFELTPQDLDAIEKDLEIPKSVLKRLADDEQRNLAIILRIEQLVETHERVIVFATTVEHAKLLTAVLQARGVLADVVSGESAPEERQRIIDSFRRDGSGSRVLCNFGVLTTGFDAPRTSAAVIARPTTSLVLYSQMVGRAIRGPRVGGNARAEIVTVVDTALPGFASVAEAFVNWNDVWREK